MIQNTENQVFSIEEKYSIKSVEPKKNVKSVFIPSNLDIKNHLARHPPIGFRPSMDRIAFILSQITERPYYDRSLYSSLKYDENPFIPLSSQFLKRRIHNYEKYLVYLVDTGIIESNNSYEVGVSSKGYRYTKAYLEKIVDKTISDPKLVKESISTSGTEQANSRYSHLISWFNGLTIDKQACMLFIESHLEQEVIKNRSEVTNSLRRRNIHVLTVSKVFNKDFYFTVDDYSNRFHTILTNMKSSLRKFLKYEDKSLVSIDLSSSQPFLILNLLCSTFYKQNIESNRINFEAINHNINPLISPPYTPGAICSIMCGSFENHEIYREIRLYKDLVKNNCFYDYCIDRISEIQKHQNVFSRDHVKNIVLSVIFSSNEESNPYLVKNKATFRAIFPFISSVLEAWKHSNGNNLAKILQKIESFLFLDCIAARIAHERPDLPIFTIHDSIVTLVGEENYVMKVMRDEIRSRTGFNPHFKTEYWEGEGYDDCIEIKRKSL